MGKSKEDKKEKKEKEVKSSTDKVSKKDKKEKKDKSSKDKKDKKIKKDVVERLYDELTGKKEEEKKDVEVKDAASDSEDEEKPVAVSQAELLVFAQPLLDGKLEKKVLKLIRKGAKARLLRRGVKEVVKHVRKLPTSSKPSAVSKYPQGFVVLAADISPMDVISHIPVLCEDHEVPYVFIRSRADLGKAAGTKRLTSAVACVPGGKKGSEEEKEFAELFEKCFEEVREADRKVPV